MNMYVKSFELFHSKTDHSANVFQMLDKFNYNIFLFYQCNVRICMFNLLNFS